VWTDEIIEGRLQRCQAMTGLPGDQAAELVTVVFGLLDGVWQPVRGRRRVLGLYRAVVLTLFLLRRNESQAVAGELFGCSQATVSRIVRRLRPLLQQATAELAGQAIAHLVNWKILDSGWRGRLSDFPEVLRTVTGLEIYRTWG
jgi:hypothetical protein